MNQNKHKPVLLSEVEDILSPKAGERYLDVTAGYGGHASAVIDAIGSSGSAVLVDRDQNAVSYLKEMFGSRPEVKIVKNDFLSASKDLQATGAKFDLILADLGVSSPHLDNAMRGFSFTKEGPLDMRMDEDQPITAADIVNTADEAELTRILRLYGEVRSAHRVSRLIIEHRPYHSTTELANIVAKTSKRWEKTHPATKVFQALRIAVNQELEMLEQALPIWIDLLNDNGRLAVISFHSLEDRLVKQAFAEYGASGYDAVVRILTKHPIEGDKSEIVFNPRARSAKLRAVAKIKI